MTGHSWRLRSNISKHETTVCFYWGVGTFLSRVSGSNTRHVLHKRPRQFGAKKIRSFEQNVQSVWFVRAALDIMKPCAMTKKSESECRRREEVMTKVMNDMKRVTEGRSCDFSFEGIHRWRATWAIQRALASFSATCSHNTTPTKDEKPSTLWHWRFRWIDVIWLKIIDQVRVCRLDCPPYLTDF